MTGESPLGPHKASAVELKRRIEAERLGTPFLVYRDDTGQEQLRTLDDTSSGKITLGRSDDADISLAWDSEVSSVHAELEAVGDGWAIIDDGLSRNGTYVNGERLTGRRRLRDGDVVRIGGIVAAYRAPTDTDGKTTLAAEGMPTRADLSETQQKVLIALCRPFKHSEMYTTPATNQQIAEELFLSVDAVKTHLRTLFNKFEIADLPQNQKRARLVECAFQSGLVSDREL
jgi:hypothetical protein